MTKFLTEQQEAEIFSQWLTIKRIKHTHIPNETGRDPSAFRRALRMKRAGTSRGFPDYCIVLPNKLLFLELKRAKKSLSRVSEEQKDWISALNAVGGQIEAIVAYGAEEAIEEVQKRL